MQLFAEGLLPGMPEEARGRKKRRRPEKRKTESFLVHHINCCRFFADASALFCFQVILF